MAGLLDSDLVQFLAAPRAYYQRKNQMKDAEAFQGLLGGLEQQGPVQPGGLLESRAPDRQFWLKAAAIPGYEGLAGQQLGYQAAGEQAMQRQVQQQDFSLNNLTKEQAQNLALNRAKFGWDQQVDETKLGYEGMRTGASVNASNASATNSLQGAALANARLTKQLADNATANGPLYNQLQPKERMEVNQKLLRNEQAVNSTQEVLDWVLNRNPSEPLRGIGTARGGAMAADWMLSALPVTKDMVGAGALDEGERKWMLDIVGSPDALHLTENEENRMKLIGQKIMDYTDQQFQAVGLAPPTKRGKGAVSRALGGTAKGELRPYTPKTGLLNPGAP